MNDEKNLTLKEAFNLAVKNHQNKNLQDAQNYYYKVLKIDPNFLSAHNNLGAIFKELGEKQKAIGCYKKAIEINPDLFDPFRNLANIYVSRLTDFETAISKSNEALKIYELNKQNLTKRNKTSQSSAWARLKKTKNRQEIWQR